MAQLQRAFQSRVLAQGSSIAEAIAEPDPAAARERLGIYEHAYRSRLSDALATAFPKVKRALGDIRFTRLASRFALEHPSEFPSVRDYGARFGAFLSQSIGNIKGHGLEDLAAFEWALAAAFDGPDTTVVTIADLAAVAPERWPDLAFTFAPTLQRLATTSNAVQWWRADDANLPSRWRKLRTAQWAIARRDLAVYFRSLDPAETLVLDLARAGATFGVLCEALRDRTDARDENATALTAARYLQQWVQDVWIARVAVGSSNVSTK